jgi:hypothetical protein
VIGVEITAFFVIILFLGWTVVLPFWSLYSASKARRRERETRERVAARNKAFARAVFGVEWNGAYRKMPFQDVETVPVPVAEAIGEAQPADPQPHVIVPPAPRPSPLPPTFVPRGPRPQPQTIVPPRPAKAPAAPPPARGSAGELRAAVARYSAWREHVRPFLIENIGWFIGGFLVVAGSLYFLREAWGSFAQLGRQMLVLGTALSYAAGFVGVAFWLKRSHGLATASRAMAYVGLALVPVAALAASGVFDLNVLAWSIAAPLVVALAYPLLYLAAGLLDRELSAPLSRALVALAGLTAVAPAVAALSPAAVLLLPYLGWAALHRASRAPLRGPGAPPSGTLAFHLSALAYSLLFLLGRSHVLGGGALPVPAFYGPLAVLLSFTALRVDVELRARWGGQAEIDAVVVASFAAALSGIALAVREPAYLSLSAALAAAHFAIAIAWYRRPVLVYFSIAAGTSSVISLLVFSRFADASFLAGLALVVCSALAAILDGRFRVRGEPRLASAAGRSAAALLLGAAATSAIAAAAGNRLGPALVLALAAAVLATWHRKAPREWTAWSGAAAFSGALVLALLRLPLEAGAAFALAGLVLVAAAVSLLRERLGARALAHCSLVVAAVALAIDVAKWQRGLSVFALVWSAGAVLLGSAAIGLVASGAGLLLLALSILGPDAFASLPAASPRWAAVPVAALAASFVLRRFARLWKGPRPLGTSFARPGLLALADPLLAWGAFATTLLAVRGGFSPDSAGALLLAIAAACAVALAALSRDVRWSAVAAGFAILAGAWEAMSVLGLRVSAAALGAAVVAFAILAAGRALRSLALAHVVDVATVALCLATAAALFSAAVAFQLAPSPNDLRLSCIALALCAAGLIALSMPVRAAAGVPALLALAGCAWSLPLALGWSAAFSGVALAALALLLLWTSDAVASGPDWASPILVFGPHFAAGAAVLWNLLSPGPFLDWNRALCDGLLLGYLGSVLAIEGGVVYLHLLLGLVALGVVRARTLLGIVPSGWGTVLAGAALVAAALLVRRRQKYAFALLVWSALSLGYTCVWALGAPFVRADRWNRMAAAALVAVPLAAQFFPEITSGAAVVALTTALLAAVAALLPSLWTAATWPLAPAVLALVFALAAEGLGRLRPSIFCAPAPLARSLRTGAVLLATVPAVVAALPVVAATLRLAGAAPAGPGLLAALPLALGGATLAIVFRKVPAATMWAVSIAASLALCAVLLPAASVWLPSAGALLLLAQATVAAAVSYRDEESSWVSLALWIAALVATHLRFGEWTTPAVAFAGIWYARRVRLPLNLSAPTAIALAAAASALAWGTTWSPFLARAGVAAPLGLLAAAAMLFHEKRGAAANASVLALTAAILLCAGGTGGSAEARAVFLLGGGLLLLLLCAGRARSEPRYLYLAALPSAAAYVWVRGALGMFTGWEAADASVALGAAFLLALLSAAVRESEVSAPLAHLSAVLPGAVFFVAPPGTIPACAAAAAALYGLLAWLRRSRLSAYAALALVNVCLFASFGDRGLTDLQVYTVPLGLSVLAAAQISHGDLSRRSLSWLRAFGCLVLYAGTAVEMLQFEGATYPLILGGLALLTVVAGVGLQIRAFALFGAATLIADVLANLLRASAQSSRVMAFSATVTGFLILGAMIWLSVKREETLDLYRRLVRAMDDWE